MVMSDELDELRSNIDTICSLFDDRSQIWIDMCVAIANRLPGAWGCIEKHIDARYNLVEVRLIDLALSPYTEMMTYTVSAETPSGDTRSFFILDVPLCLAIGATDDDCFMPLLDYLETTPNVVDQLISDDNPLDVRNKAIADAIKQFPDHDLSVEKIRDLSNRLESGDVFLSQGPQSIQ